MYENFVSVVVGCSLGQDFNDMKFLNVFIVSQGNMTVERFLNHVKQLYSQYIVSSTTWEIAMSPHRELKDVTFIHIYTFIMLSIQPGFLACHELFEN